MGTFDIGLTLGKKPVFAPICVACEKASPDHTMEISILGADTGSLAENVTEGLLGTTVGSRASNNKTVRITGIPVCRGCESRLKWYHRLFKFATYTIWLPALLIFLAMPGPMWIRVIVLLGIIIAPPILTMIVPPAFGATILNGNANFEFKSKLVADEFLRLNVEAQAPAKESEKSELQPE